MTSGPPRAPLHETPAHIAPVSMFHTWHALCDLAMQPERRRALTTAFTDLLGNVDEQGGADAIAVVRSTLLASVYTCVTLLVRVPPTATVPASPTTDGVAALSRAITGLPARGRQITALASECPTYAEFDRALRDRPPDWDALFLAAGFTLRGLLDYRNAADPLPRWALLGQIAGGLTLHLPAVRD